MRCRPLTGQSCRYFASGWSNSDPAPVDGSGVGTANGTSARVPLQPRCPLASRSRRVPIRYRAMRSRTRTQDPARDWRSPPRLPAARSPGNLQAPAGETHEPGLRRWRFPSCLPEHPDGHREQSESGPLNSLAIMEQDAACEAVANPLPEVLQPPEITGPHGPAALTAIPTTAPGERSRTRSTSTPSLSR